MSSPEINNQPLDIKKTAWTIWEIVGNVLLAAFFLRFLISTGVSLQQCFRFSSLLLAIKLSIDVFFLLTRRPANKVSLAPYDWVIGIFGTYCPLFFQTINGQDLVVGQAIQMVGLSLQMLGILSLNRSFGLVAANRGIKKDGMYKYVRHPLYFAYTISYFGFTLNQLTMHNCIIYTCMLGLLYLRIIAEERLLNQSEEYQTYCQSTRWRLIPFVI